MPPPGNKADGIDIFWVLAACPVYSEAADRKRALGQNVGVAVNAL